MVLRRSVVPPALLPPQSLAHAIAPVVNISVQHIFFTDGKLLVVAGAQGRLMHEALIVRMAAEYIGRRRKG